jgi:hypothetical protein
MPDGFFKIRERSIVSRGWGDFGYILQHGMTDHLPRVEGRLALQRVGPYIPPITLPGIGDVVLTSEAQKLLESSTLSGFSFLPVEKTLIVELHWETWKLDAEQPAEFPESDEPEDNILGKPHSHDAAKKLGELWEIVVPSTATILRPMRAVSSYRELCIDQSTWNGSDLFRGEGYGSILFSERGRDWFCEHWGNYVQFDQFPAT